MAYRDLHSFLDALDRRGDLIRLDHSVHPRLEASAVMRALGEAEGPAVLFENLKGHQVPALGNLLSAPRRLELALGIKSNYRQAIINRLNKQLKPRRAREVPVQQVVLDKDIDLSSLLPVFTYHERDAGPYITAGIILFRDPKTDQVKSGIYRMQIRKPHLLSVQIVSPSLRSLVNKKGGDALPIAVVLGVEPGLFLGSVLQVSEGVDKLDSAGGLRGQPVQIADAVTLDLPVPAHAEMVLEGRILPGTRVTEGPMGESSGVYTKSRSFLIEVKAVTHRQNYLYHALLPWSWEEEVLRTVAYTIPMEERLRAQEPAVQTLHLVPGTCATHAVISMRKNQSAQARDLIHHCFGLFPVLKQVVVVDEDVNPENPQMVSWALATRFQADRDLITLPEVTGFAIDPSARRKDGRLLATQVGMDATIPTKSRAKFERIGVGARAKRKAAKILSDL